MHNRNLRNILAVAVAVTAGSFGSPSSFAATTTVSALAKETHFHGIAVDPADSSRVYLATHNGLYVVAPDGSADAISDAADDFMGFTAHPTDPATLFASGHPASGGNTGFNGEFILAILFQDFRMELQCAVLHYDRYASFRCRIRYMMRLRSSTSNRTR